MSSVTLLRSSRFSLITAVLNWLSETPAQKQSANTPGYLSVGMACTYNSCSRSRNVKLMSTTTVLAVGVVRPPAFLKQCFPLLNRPPDIHPAIPSTTAGFESRYRDGRPSRRATLTWRSGRLVQCNIASAFHEALPNNVSNWQSFKAHVICLLQGQDFFRQRWSCGASLWSRHNAKCLVCPIVTCRSCSCDMRKSRSSVESRLAKSDGDAEQSPHADLRSAQKHRHASSHSPHHFARLSAASSSYNATNNSPLPAAFYFRIQRNPFSNKQRTPVDPNRNRYSRQTSLCQLSKTSKPSVGNPSSHCLATVTAQRSACDNTLAAWQGLSVAFSAVPWSTALSMRSTEADFVTRPLRGSRRRHWRG